MPNPAFDRLVLNPELAAAVMTPVLRMSLGQYRRQLAESYQPNPDYDRLLVDPMLYAQMDTAHPAPCLTTTAPPRLPTQTNRSKPNEPEHD